MDYPYINLDLLKEYVVYFHGDIDKWANTMQYAVESYDGEQHLLCNVTWDNDYYITVVATVLTCLNFTQDTCFKGCSTRTIM